MRNLQNLDSSPRRIMKILFAKLCAFFLVAVTTVSIGAPIENTNTSMVTHLYKRDTFPICNAPYTRLIFSSCSGWNQMLVRCSVAYNTDITTTNIQPCGANERCVPFAYFNTVTGEIAARAKCVASRKRTREWQTDEERPRKRVCAQRVSYVASENARLATGVGLYTALGNLAIVDQIEVYRDGKLYDSNTDKCNLSSIVTPYNGEPIQYCFTSSSVTIVIGIAAAEVINGSGTNGVDPADEVLQVKELQ